MFSLLELNQVMRMDYPRHKIVRWHPAHIQLIDLNKFDQDNFNKNPKNLENFYRYAETGMAYTAIGDGTIYAMFGVWEFWKGVAEAWLIPSDRIDRKTLSMHRASLRFFELYANKYQIKRLQFTTNSLNVRAVKWAERCYFKREAEMKHYGLNGETYYLYARLF